MRQRVCILLSTFNGADFVSEQLDSLIGQSHRDLRIHVRDDGSSDESGQILARYARRNANFSVEFGSNLGASESYFRLLLAADSASDYFAFCDQDDVWHTDKIERAVTRLAGTSPDTPVIYCSRLQYVGQNLSPLSSSRLPHRGLSFQNALVENVAVGCTLVMNRAARELIIERLPSQCVMYDWWCYLVVSAFGIVVYDDVPTINYRLHMGNTIGAAVSVWGQFGRRARRFALKRRGAFSIHGQAAEFLNIFAERLPAREFEILSRFVESKRSIWRRIGYAVNPEVYRQSRLDGLLLRVLLLLDWY